MLKLSTRGRIAARYTLISLVGLITVAIALSARSGLTAVAAPQAAPAAEGRSAMVVSESADGTRAGIEILKQGGNAVDAAVATALAVGITNASSCGVGGGGFMLIYVAKLHHMYALDYRETAPLKASPTMYSKNGKADEKLARDGGLAVAVPGEIAGD